ncbi:PREDICTED: uncharacterized protein LOC109585976 isoform X2 [Amphimedon queenslandica]|uniref:Uncharacterized protein n=1 Tax=Amphimedon queenslandica TaxID=400682 RepID=A0AAN0JKX4_AMPQE|nr:PREDICTED: uncharacterized protein LOC109585976 isoform X2 [Amphimedon queenslandica]|eukprot:XP_019857677.1 PREDICTED: uncharacterized protein LOC109585976 isoform X2 [Amphimedon queenslandica]
MEDDGRGQCSNGNNGGEQGSDEASDSSSSSSSHADPISDESSICSGPSEKHHHDDTKPAAASIEKAKWYIIATFGDECESQVIFAATKRLNALIEYIKKYHNDKKKLQDAPFQFEKDKSYIELIFDSEQKPQDIKEWVVTPLITPCKFFQQHINDFGDKKDSFPPSCLVYADPLCDAVPVLRYSVPVKNVIEPFSLLIYKRRDRSTSSSSNTITEVTAVSSNGGASVPANVVIDVDKVKKVINDVLVSHHARLNYLKTSLSDLANQLYEVGLINDEVRETCSMDKFIAEFKASFHFLDDMSEVQDHCKKFLNSFIAVRGSYINAAKFLRQKWTEAIKTELGIDFIID